MTLKFAATLTGIGLELMLLLVLVRRRAFSSLPVFTLYIAVSLFTDTLALAVYRFFLPYYAGICIVNVLLDFAFFLALLMELGRNLLRYNRVTVPNWFLAILLFVIASLILYMLSPWSIEPHLPFVWRMVLHAVQATVILEFAAFLALVWWAGLRRLHWPGRELRIATGFGLYTLIALIAAVVHTHQSIDRIYRQIDLFVVICYLGVLAYWSGFFMFEDKKVPQNRKHAYDTPTSALRDDRDPYRYSR